MGLYEFERLFGLLSLKS